MSLASGDVNLATANTGVKAGSFLEGQGVLKADGLLVQTSGTLSAVAEGTGRVLSEIEFLRKVSTSD